MAVIGIGIDAVDVPRMRKAATGSVRADRLRSRVFTDHERALCESRPDPAQCLAARFAAKEAVMKALGADGIAFAFRDIEVVRAGDGRPSIRLHGRVADKARELGVQSVHVSLTHLASVAMASVVLEDGRA